MKLILIGPGVSPIPPKGWGAVETIVWDYYENLKNDLDVIIINDTVQNSIHLCNSHKPDIVHIMYDDHIIMVPYLNCKKILYTSHFAYITHPHFEQNYNSYFRNIFQKAIQYQDKIIIHAISTEIADKYRKHGFVNKINVIGNGAREDLFKYTLHPTKKEKSVYIAKIEYRKAQYKYQTIPNIDFVGNYHDSPFHKGPNYIGEWDKNTLYDSLTEYGNLILLSEGEADPLVVKEGLIAGLGVVVSECSSANLDLSKQFITVIPNDKLNDLEYISKEIEKNREYSILNREEIRNYAENFAWNTIIPTYRKALESLT